MPRVSGKSPSSARVRTTATRKVASRGPGRPAGANLGREAIVRAACGLLRQYSYGEVTISAVARALQVDPALIRYYFGDHHALMAAASLALKAEFRACVRTALARCDGTPEGLIRARVSALVTISSRYRFAIRLLSDFATRNAKAAVRKSIQGMTGDGMQYYDRLLSAGAASGRLRRVEPLFLSMAVLGMVDLFTIQEPLFRAGQRLGVRSATDLRRHYEQFIVDLLLNGLKAQ